jgi:hypothetical protein
MGERQGAIPRAEAPASAAVADFAAAVVVDFTEAVDVANRSLIIFLFLCREI